MGEEGDRGGKEEGGGEWEGRERGEVREREWEGKREGEEGEGKERRGEGREREEERTEMRVIAKMQSHFYELKLVTTGVTFLPLFPFPPTYYLG